MELDALKLDFGTPRRSRSSTLVASSHIMRSWNAYDYVTCVVMKLDPFPWLWRHATTSDGFSFFSSRFLFLAHAHCPDWLDKRERADLAVELEIVCILVSRPLLATLPPRCLPRHFIGPSSHTPETSLLVTIRQGHVYADERDLTVIQTRDNMPVAPPYDLIRSTPPDFLGQLITIFPTKISMSMLMKAAAVPRDSPFPQESATIKNSNPRSAESGTTSCRSFDRTT
ncbi:hypothetical protein BC826DRAFT_241395 [Russula brevipes]|nr:hypothetical protein BC826DRAFT_241395 [Russula brevipes]